MGKHQNELKRAKKHQAANLVTSVTNRIAAGKHVSPAEMVQAHR